MAKRNTPTRVQNKGKRAASNARKAAKAFKSIAGVKINANNPDLKATDVMTVRQWKEKLEKGELSEKQKKWIEERLTDERNRFNRQMRSMRERVNRGENGLWLKDFNEAEGYVRQITKRKTATTLGKAQSLEQLLAEADTVSTYLNRGTITKSGSQAEYQRRKKDFIDQHPDLADAMREAIEQRNKAESKEEKEKWKKAEDSMWDEYEYQEEMYDGLDDNEEIDDDMLYDEYLRILHSQGLHEVFDLYADYTEMLEGVAVLMSTPETAKKLRETLKQVELWQENGKRQDFGYNPWEADRAIQALYTETTKEKMERHLNVENDVRDKAWSRASRMRG